MKNFYIYKGSGNEVDEKAAWDYINDGYVLPPRTVLKGRKKILQQELSPLPCPPHQGEGKTLSSLVQENLGQAMGKMTGEPRAIMFTGGFDSMFIACLAKRAGANVTAVTVAFDDFNIQTVLAAKQAAHQAGIKHHVLHVKLVDFLSAFENLATLTEEPVLDLDLGIVYSALRKYDPLIAGDIFISGMGSDQWFGDMALESIPGGLAARLDWANVNEDAHHRLAEAFGFKFCFPFLSTEMLALSQGVPADMKKGKKLLRALALGTAIPHRGSKSEEQVPAFMRLALIKKYGSQAWPLPVLSQDRNSYEEDRALRQIILGLWIEKRKSRITFLRSEARCL